MKLLDLIRYITINYNQFDTVEFTEDQSRLSPMEAINHLASIDPSWYDDFRYYVVQVNSENKLYVHKK